MAHVKLVMAHLENVVLTDGDLEGAAVSGARVVSSRLRWSFLLWA